MKLRKMVILSYFSWRKILFTLLLAVAIVLNGCSSTEKLAVVHFQEVDSSLVNPGRGFTTTGNLLNDGLVEKHIRYPLSGVFQKRYYWDELEPNEGEINFSKIDQDLLECSRNGQQLNFRIMCQSEEMRIPQWALKKGIGEPFYDNPVFLELQQKLIQALADRYDGAPDLAFVDIGTVGQWGEWHTEQAGIKMPSESSAHRIVDMYINSFVKTPLMMLIGAGEPLEYALSRGAGWRADCWGDMGTEWAHMKVRYPEFFDKAPGINNAWKHAPVALETCWTIQYWYEQGWDIDYILAKALEWHATEVNNGSETIPKEWWAKILNFEKKLGYRFVLDDFKYQDKVKNGDQFRYEMNWRNVGVAPIYQPYPLALKLTPKDNPSLSKIIITEADIRKWLPGKNDFKSSVTIPPDLPKGKYDLELGILDQGKQQPYIRIAISGGTTDGWYPVGSLRLE